MNTRLSLLVALLAVLSALSPGVQSAEDGDTLDLDAYSGNVVVLDFWASWCVPCRRSFPWLNQMHARYEQDGLVIIGVNVDQESQEAAEFLNRYPAQFRIHYDSAGKLATEFGVRGMPSSFVIGRDGRLSAEHLGFKVRRQDEYEAAIVAALEQEKME
jgi:thiol-disulfide isomerase/thioredoxin